MFKWPEKLPPSIVLLIGFAVGVVIAYFYTKTVVQVDILEATVQMIRDDNKVVVEIQKEEKHDAVKAALFEKKVREDEKKIKANPWTKPYPVDVRMELLTEISRARSESD